MSGAERAPVRSAANFAFDAEPDERFRVHGAGHHATEGDMFGWAITFLIVALIAGALGFGLVAGAALAAAKILFVVALLAFLISAVMGYSRRGAP
jgi:uncharacterized membrane protein YtjA (UPF0391 family)